MVSSSATATRYPSGPPGSIGVNPRWRRTPPALAAFGVVGAGVEALPEAAGHGPRQREVDQAVRPSPGPAPHRGHLADGEHLRPADVGGPAGRGTRGQGRHPVATSVAAIGWVQKARGSGATGRRSSAPKAMANSSWNWVARRIVQGPGRLHQPLAGQLAAVVPVADGVHADDGQVDDVGAVAHRRQEVRRLALVALTQTAGVGGGMDHHLGPGHRGGQPRSPVARSPTWVPTPGRRESTRTSRSARASKGTSWRPKVPLPPVTSTAPMGPW